MTFISHLERYLNPELIEFYDLSPSPHHTTCTLKVLTILDLWTHRLSQPHASSNLWLFAFDLCMCISRLLLLLPSTARAKLTAHKNTHKMLVCFVCLDRQGVPWVFGDNFLVKLYISFPFMYKKKANWLFYSCLHSFSLFPAVETNLLIFLGPQHAHIISLI